MEWNFDNPAGREGTNCIKFDRREEVFGKKDIIPMWVADMDFSAPHFITEALKAQLSNEIFGYSFRPPEYFSSIAEWQKHRHNWDIREEWIVFTPGVVPALNLAVLAFTKPGDRIIVQPPVYFPFFSAVEAHGRTLVHNQLKEEDGQWEMDFDALHNAVDENTRMIIISNPHNPVGRAWSRRELEELASICIRNNILMLSDEIHCDLVLPGFKHTPLALLSEEAESDTITFIAPSKTFNLAGLSTSTAIISDPGLRKTFARFVDNLHIGNGNIFGTAVSVAAYSRGHEWLDALLRYIDHNVDYVMDYCAKMIPEIVPVQPEATYMIWLDCRKLGMNGRELSDFFVHKASVGMNEGSTFGPGGEGFMRMNLATTHWTVIKAMEQIEKAVSDLR
jgi:cystathionine beta-lyase